MSMYNMVCGNNPMFAMYARILDSGGTPLPEVPGFRDVYTRIVDPDIQIVIYTRTGGNNRDEYEEANQKLTEHPYYVSNWDDDFDSTFAHFAFHVPAKYEANLLKFHNLMAAHPKFKTPREKFDMAMASLEGRAEEIQTISLEDAEEAGAVAYDLMEGLPEMSSLEKQLMPRTEQPG